MLLAFPLQPGSPLTLCNLCDARYWGLNDGFHIKFRLSLITCYLCIHVFMYSTPLGYGRVVFIEMCTYLASPYFNTDDLAASFDMFLQKLFGPQL